MHAWPDLLLKTVLYGIWKFRNKSTFHNGNEDSHAIIRYIKTDIRKRISLDHFRLSNSELCVCLGVFALCYF